MLNSIANIESNVETKFFCRDKSPKKTPISHATRGISTWKSWRYSVSIMLVIFSKIDCNSKKSSFTFTHLYFFYWSLPSYVELNRETTGFARESFFQLSEISLTFPILFHCSSFYLVFENFISLLHTWRASWNSSGAVYTRNFQVITCCFKL